MKIVEMLVDAVRKKKGSGAVAGFVNAQDEDGETPLMMACRGDHGEVVKVLLAAGAKKDITSGDGLTAKDYTEDESCRKLVA